MFADDVKRFALKVERQERAVFEGVVLAAHASIVQGSHVTGAPGQPVDTGHLKASWQVDIEGDVGTIGTNVEYAPAIEDGIGPHGPLTLRSEVGGFHSVAMTRAGFPRLVEQVTREVAR
jgi:phage gpG-like protein